MDTNLESLIFKKPKKCGDYFVCKLGDPMVLQFPKMILTGITDKNMELEFISDSTKYYREVYDYLTKLDDHIINYIYEHSKEWFNKKIPLTNIKQMYNKFIKSPKTSESKCTLTFALNNDAVLIDNKKNVLEMSDFKDSDTIECISQLKYIVFSKDTCFITWELQSAKKYTKIEKVVKYGFIDDHESDSDSEELNFSFF
jgi:hypothetical protein